MASIATALISGDRVVIRDLVGQVSLNGQQATLLHFHEDVGRWAVAVDGRAEAVRVKPQNVVPLVVPELAHDLLVHVFLHIDGANDKQQAKNLALVGMVSRSWRLAAADKGLEQRWRAMCLRASPAAPATGEGFGAEDYVCTPFTNPTATSPLARQCPASIGSYRLLFSRRTRAAAAAAKAYRVVGTCDNAQDGGEMDRFCCTRLDERALRGDPPPLRYSDLSFTFELFERDGCRRDRRYYNLDYAADEGEDPKTVEDYLSPAVLSAFAGPPHFSGDRFENLIWCSTVRGEPAPEAQLVKAPAPVSKAPAVDDRSPREQLIAQVMGRPAPPRLLRRTTVGIDTRMDDYFSEWCEPYRMVVTATRDTDGKMCQLVDVRGGGGQGFKEIGGDSCTGGVSVSIVPPLQGGPGLDAFCYFGANDYGTEIASQIEPPGADALVDKGWKGMMNAAFESLGALHSLELQFEKRWAPPAGTVDPGEIYDFEDAKQRAEGKHPTDEQIAAMLGQLEWH